MFEQYRLHHVGVVFPSIEEAEAHMAAFGLVEDYRGYVSPWHAWCIFTVPAPGATTAIELVVADGGALQKFNKGAGGVHHYAFEIDDFASAEAWLAARDMRMLEPEPIMGAGNFLCNFVHPVGTRGIMIEFVKPLD